MRERARRSDRRSSTQFAATDWTSALVGALRADRARRDVDQLDGVLEEDDGELLGRGDVGDRLEVVEAHPGELVDAECIELPVAEADLELAELGEQPRRRRRTMPARGATAPR